MNFIGGTDLLYDDSDDEFMGGGLSQTTTMSLGDRSIGSLVGGDYFSDNEDSMVEQMTGGDIDSVKDFSEIFKNILDDNMDNIGENIIELIKEDNEDLSKFIEDKIELLKNETDKDQKRKILLKVVTIIYIYSHNNVNDNKDSYTLDLTNYKSSSNSNSISNELNLLNEDNVEVEKLINNIRMILIPDIE